MKKRYILVIAITALCLSLFISFASAAISDKISDTYSHDTNAKIKAEEYAKVITAKETTVTKDNLPFKYNIKKISYNDKMKTVDLYVNLYINGREKAVRNPIHIRNPPVYHITSMTFDSKTGVTAVEKEENPDAVIAQILYDHALTLKDGKAENDDTLIAYVTEDARIGNTTDGDWYGIRNYAGDYVDRTTDTISTAIAATATTNVWSSIYELGFIADTSGMSPNVTVVQIDDADLYLYYATKGQTLSGTFAVQITGAYPANYNQWAATDYRRISNTTLNGWQPISSFSTAGYTRFPINDVGAINKTGKTAIMARLSNDVNNTEPTWGSSQNVYINFRMADYAGTTSDPYFKLTYSEGSILPVADFTNTTGFPRSGQLVPGGFKARFTDTSDETPTTWNWSFGDGNMTNSTAQNPIHTYLDQGFFNVSLEVCNIIGCDSWNETSYVRVLPQNMSQDSDFVAFTARNGTSPLSVGFVFNTSTSTKIDSYNWYFGDGNTSTSQNPVFTYRPDGTYSVSLTLVNATLGNLTITKDNYIVVSSLTPITGDFVAFTARNGTTPLSVGFVVNITGSLADSWYWAFGESNTSTQQNPVFTYRPWGCWTVAVTAVNATLGNTTFTKPYYINVSVSAAAPTPTPTVPPILELPWCDKPDLFFWWNDTGDITNYRTMNNVPEIRDQIFTQVTVDQERGPAPLGCWSTPAAKPGVTWIAPGIWRFRTYHNVSPAVGNSYIQFQVFNRSLDGTETDLFYGLILTKEINTLTTEEYLTSYAKRNWTKLFTGDRLVIKAFGCTTSVNARTISMAVAGNTNASMVSMGWLMCDDDCGSSMIGLAGSGALPPEDDTDMLLMAAITGGMVAGVTVAYLFRKRGNQNPP